MFPPQVGLKPQESQSLCGDTRAGNLAKHPYQPHPRIWNRVEGSFWPLESEQLGWWGALVSGPAPPSARSSGAPRVLITVAPGGLASSKTLASYGARQSQCPPEEGNLPRFTCQPQLHLAHSLVVQTGPGRGGDLPGHTQQQCLARGPCCLAVVILKESQRKPCVLPDGMFNPGVQGKRPRRVPCIIRGKPWAKNTFAELEAGGRVSSLSRGWGWLLMGQNRKTSRDIWNGVGHQANFELQHFSSHLMSHRVLTGMATGSGQGRDAGLREGPLWRE